VPRVDAQPWQRFVDHTDDHRQLMPATSVVTRPNRALDITLAVVLVVVGVSAYFAAGASNAPAATPRTTTVTRGVVLSSVQASGNVQPGQTYSVGFQTSGTVNGINVDVGEHVVKGQTLATVDPTIASANLASAQASLNSAQANLAQVEQVQTPTQRAQAQATASAAQRQLGTAQMNLGFTQQNIASTEAGLQGAVTNSQNKLNADQAAKASPTQISQDQQALANAQHAQASGVAKDQQTLAQSQNQVDNAQGSLNSTDNTNAAGAQLLPSNLAQAQATVAQAQAQFTSAQQTMGYTTLRAPADGVVTAINGAVGTTVSGGGVSASQSTTTAGASGASSSGGGGGGGAGGGAAASTSSTTGSGGSSSPFITITNLDNLSVKAGFAETDAAKLAVGQPAVITFNALPNAQAAGQVTEVDVNSTLVSNVVTYYATVAIAQAPAGLKPGMTASVTVTVARHEGVLAVPSGAVRGNGSTGTVSVMNGKTATVQTVSVGLRGDTLTEVTSGLNPGQTVELPSNTLSGVSSQVRNQFGARGFGGAGGGGFGGGAGGAGGGLRAGG
jgi:multidrug efflux pump subunit AcrA (membrane-fusion protein)